MVTPVNGFTGSVNLTFTNPDGMAATPTFSVQPVNITTSAGVTTSFVVVASEATSATAKVVPQRNHPVWQSTVVCSGFGRDSRLHAAVDAATPFVAGEPCWPLFFQ